MDNRYIVVEGPIGVGKTSLSNILAERFGARRIFEWYEENPFLASFYEDRQKYAFQTQIFFLLSRFRQQQELVPAGPLQLGDGQRLPVRQGPHLRAA